MGASRDHQVYACAKAAALQQVPQECPQTGLEYLQRRRLHRLSGIIVMPAKYFELSPLGMRILVAESCCSKAIPLPLQIYILLCREYLRKEIILLFFLCSAVSGGKEIVQKCVCILQSSCVNVHSIDGKDYVAALPFQVSASPCFPSVGLLSGCLLYCGGQVCIKCYCW